MGQTLTIGNERRGLSAAWLDGRTFHVVMSIRAFARGVQRPA